MLLSLTVFSQNVTKNLTTDSIIPLPKSVAIEVVKDILRKDSLESEIMVAKLNIDLLQNIISNKDSMITSKDNIISIYKEKEKNYTTVITLKDLQKKNLEDLVAKLNHDLKRQKLKLFARTTFGAIIIGGLTYLILK